MRHWTLFALFCGASGIAAGIAACSSSSSTDPVLTGDGGNDDASNGQVASCPKAMPDAGTLCSAPEGTTCAFGVCDGVFAVCTGGVWQSAPVTPVPSGCPEGVPTAGSTCPVCFSADASCLYPQTCAPDASVVRASCAATAWQLVTEICEGGTVDAGDATDASSDADAGG